jgi:hypothetical protein
VDETQFIIGYTAFVAVLMTVSLFLLCRGMDRKRYLRPVFYGMFFGFGAMMFFNAGLFAFLIGGLMTGYLLREVTGFISIFKAGALSGMLMYSSTLIAAPVRAVIFGFATTWSSSDMLYFCFYAALYLFQNVVFVGGAAFLGGMLRKFLASRQTGAQPQPKPAT